MTGNTADVFRHWEESLLALSRYCVHYGLDDDDEKAIKAYLAVCAQSGRPAKPELVKLIHQQGNTPSDDTPILRTMTLANPEWEWVCQGTWDLDCQVSPSDLPYWSAQTQTKIEIDVRRLSGTVQSKEFRLGPCLHVKVTLTETAGAESFWRAVWRRLCNRRTVRVSVYSVWRVEKLEPIVGQVMSASELLDQAEQLQVPPALISTNSHRIVHQRLLNTLDDISLDNTHSVLP